MVSKDVAKVVGATSNEGFPAGHLTTPSVAVAVNFERDLIRAVICRGSNAGVCDQHIDFVMNCCDKSSLVDSLRRCVSTFHNRIFGCVNLYPNSYFINKCIGPLTKRPKRTVN